MRKTQATGLTGFCLALTLCVSVTASEKEAEWVAPVIDGYGYFNPLPNALLRPNPETEYKVVFDVTKPNKSGGVNKGLGHVARAMNLFGVDGKPAKNLDVVVIIHGGATRSVLNDVAHKARYGKSNPDAEILAKLKNAGVKIYVCGQAIVDNGYYYQNVRSEVGVVLGAVAAEIELVTNGYALIQL